MMRRSLLIMTCARHLPNTVQATSLSSQRRWHAPFDIAYSALMYAFSHATRLPVDHDAPARAVAALNNPSTSSSMGLSALSCLGSANRTFGWSYQCLQPEASFVSHAQHARTESTQGAG
ncbi:hypothetical protein GGR52DRAFT_428587 [Hypoxylon sp. FL1284]|nr:hypothetical protein GGR52DRAFT_428587 [Hypoxylon sp. FL1284]